MNKGAVAGKGVEIYELGDACGPRTRPRRRSRPRNRCAERFRSTLQSATGAFKHSNPQSAAHNRERGRRRRRGGHVGMLSPSYLLSYSRSLTALAGLSTVPHA
jgi:hypothetical protein